jgi:hypothetical protein
MFAPVLLPFFQEVPGNIQVIIIKELKITPVHSCIRVYCRLGVNPEVCLEKKNKVK